MLDRACEPADRPAVAHALGDVLADPSTEELRQQAALALADYAHVEGVLWSLSVVALALEDSLDLRYAAFTSIERAGRTPDSIALMQADRE